MKIVVIKEFNNTSERIEEIKNEIEKKALLNKEDSKISDKDFIFTTEEHDLEDSKEIIGTMVLKKVDDKVYKINKINLLENRRNLGLGGAMVKYALEVVKKNCGKTIIVDDDKMLKDFYTKLGFIQDKNNKLIMNI
ncbi:GNAT family N-acetyltransferase [Clostridium senegalense]|uniref:GNAT family N-acetyltransferase n=1 Tax=Clostridium senegalense TaxID=1465809 RepID=UPI001C121CCD|nr:GNAT family N-acetyltransferase [Clostridium senegalense]MBU5226172.1 GNAT family N-acetyltransferase [Clostridium senegalense]